LIREKRITLYYLPEKKSYLINEAKGFVEVSPDCYTYKVDNNINGAPLFIEINGRKKLFSIDISGSQRGMNLAYIFKSSDIKTIKRILKQLKQKEMWEKKVIIKAISKPEVKIDLKTSHEMISKIITNIADKPYCIMGIVRKNGSSTTGILIEKNIVLTSSIILFNTEKYIETVKEKLTFKILMGSTIFQSKIKDFYYPSVNFTPLSYFSNNNSETPDDINDWALLYLETSYEQDHTNGKEFKYYKMIVKYF
jgi:hypothetical protein